MPNYRYGRYVYGPDPLALPFVLQMVFQGIDVNGQIPFALQDARFF